MDNRVPTFIQFPKHSLPSNEGRRSEDHRKRKRLASPPQSPAAAPISPAAAPFSPPQPPAAAPISPAAAAPFSPPQPPLFSTPQPPLFSTPQPTSFSPFPSTPYLYSTPLSFSLSPPHNDLHSDSPSNNDIFFSAWDISSPDSFCSALDYYLGDDNE
ncbi:hypothetical protein BC941DRAFT_509942 [Chlamydoabsidia padenii]|nr:hypothetical protein BC941DRAFT_509942 [Chlamydoabsidia padenii]